MKKKIVKGLCLLLMVLNLTGCVKFNVNIGINKDKSMDFSMVYAINAELLNDQQLFSEEDLNNLKNNGFNVTDYIDTSMKGIEVSRVIPNIDLVSTIADYTEFNLTAITEDKHDSFLFKIDKGFFKNKYKAKLKFNAEDSNLSNEMDPGYGESDDESIVNDKQEGNTVENPTGDIINFNNDIANNMTFVENEEDEKVDTNDDKQEEVTDDSSVDFNNNFDISQLVANMDLSVKVTLPYSALSHNATKTNNDDKELVWTLSQEGVQYMEFEFELYNMMNIYIVCGGVGLGIVLLVVIIVLILKNRKKKKDINNSISNNNNDINSDIINDNNISQLNDNNNTTLLNMQNSINSNTKIQNVSDLKEQTNNLMDNNAHVNKPIEIKEISPVNIELPSSVTSVPVNNSVVGITVKEEDKNILINNNENIQNGVNIQSNININKTNDNIQSSNEQIVNPSTNSVSKPVVNLTAVNQDSVNRQPTNIIKNNVSGQFQNMNTTQPVSNTTNVNNVTQEVKVNSMPNIGSYIHIPGQESNNNVTETKIVNNPVVNQNQSPLIQPQNNINNVQTPTPINLDQNFRNVINNQNNQNN